MKNLGNKVIKDIGLKTIFMYILGALFLTILITTGVTTIKAGQLVIGVLYFVLSALVLVPHHRLRITQTLKFVILIVLFSVLAGISGRDSPPAEQKYEHFGLGQEFNLTSEEDSFSMVIREVRKETTIIAEGKEVTTSGYFIVVIGDLVNLGSEPVGFYIGIGLKSPVELRDGQDRIYTPSYGTYSGESLSPSVTKEFNYVFETPKEASGFKFIVSDKTDVAKSVDLKR